MIDKLKYCCLTLFVLVAGCTCNNPSDVAKKQAEKIVVNLKVVRFEQELFQHKTDFKNLQKKYPAFFDFYCSRILSIKEGNDTSIYLKNLSGFVQNHAIQGLYDTVQKHYGDFEKYKLQLHDAFQLHKYYLPKENVPTVYTYISEFGYGAVPSDSMLGIGLDLFLGTQYPYYQSEQINFPFYVVKKCTPENVVPSAMKVWANYIIKPATTKQKLIDKMIEQGKIFYYLDKVMPDLNDSVKTGYSTAQLLWCNYNEYKIWEYFIKHELLYKADMMEIGAYVSEGPVTPGMPPEAPGNIGTWVGWQIVKKYMNENKSITMEQLFAEPDGQKIFSAAHYKPAKK